VVTDSGRRKLEGGTMIDQQYPVTSGQVVIKKRGEFSSIVDVKTGTQGRANEDLRELLLLCDGTKTVEDIAEQLSRNYEEPGKDVKRKMVKSIEFLEDLGFLVLADQPAYTPLIVRDVDLEWPVDVAYLEVTNTCNLSCVHCYKTAGEPLSRELTTQEWMSIIDELKELGILTIAVTGGEPFMREDIFDILEYIAGNTIRLAIFTNGTLLTPDDIEQLRKINPEKVVVSIDGATEETHERIRGKGTFRKTLETIDLLVKNGLPVRTNTVIYTGNAAELHQVAAMLLERGVQEMIFDRLMDTGRGGEHGEMIPPLEAGETITDHLREFEKEASQKLELKFTSDIGEADVSYSFCGIGTSMITLKANGDVVLCPVLSGPQFTAGNVNDVSLKELWLTDEIFQPFRECTLDDTACKSCPHKSECRGGCKARVFHYYNTVCMPDPWMCAARGQKLPGKV
jgi:radical SAM protein with 4Fe4S-binding SPASM domain